VSGTFFGRARRIGPEIGKSASRDKDFSGKSSSHPRDVKLVKQYATVRKGAGLHAVDSMAARMVQRIRPNLGEKEAAGKAFEECRLIGGTMAVQIEQP